MYRGIPTQKSCVRMGEDCQSIMATSDEGYNVVIDVADPLNHDSMDNEVICLVDKFLKSHDQNPVVTVANTIFPQSLYQAHRVTRIAIRYSKGISIRCRGKPRSLGRTIFRPHDSKSGSNEEPIYPLQELIDKIKGNRLRNTVVKAAYELAIYNSATDRNLL